MRDRDGFPLPGKFKANLLKLLAINFQALSALMLLATMIPRSGFSQQKEEWYLYTSDSLNMYVYEFGKGDTVLVVHGGFGAEHSYLIEALMPLEDSFHFILYDQRGSLRSPAPDNILSFEKLVQDVEELRRELSIGKLNIVAHSMGTRIAMAYAEKHPDKVKALTLVSGFLPESNPTYLPEFATYYLENRPEVSIEREKLNLPQNKDVWTSKMYTHSWRISFASVNVFNVTNWQEIKGGVAYFNQHTADVIYPSAPKEWDYTDVFKTSNFPISVLVGEYDYLNFSAKSFDFLLEFYLSDKGLELAAVLEAKNKRSIADLHKNKIWQNYKSMMPSLEIFTVEKAGHRIWMDEPSKFKEYLNWALKRAVN
ncbi:alpha/beta fold hydrolase [Algoriphagus resistens]|uniref:alpha/beta fold hydrolase n=1 Tax=Algoriphagus resistens TaxID=1750590 RepID=UPI0007167F54|nr:alpha/beta hydrolase [Algoriphagus resistens]